MGGGSLVSGSGSIGIGGIESVDGRTGSAGFIGGAETGVGVGAGGMVIGLGVSEALTFGEGVGNFKPTSAAVTSAGVFSTICSSRMTGSGALPPGVLGM